MSTPAPSLWTDRPDDWQSAPDAPEAATVPPFRDPPSAPRRGFGRRQAALAATAALALTGGAYAAGAELGGGGSARTAAALPAVGGTLAPSRINDLYAKASKGVVSVQVERGSGTGFVVDADGTIVTNAHVVGESRSAQVRLDDDGESFPAQVVGTDPSTDLAVLKVDPGRTGKLTVLPLASSAQVKVGDAALAVGYPLGLDETATAGIVSGLGREIQSPNGFRIDEVIQTDAPINPGNSGGPLLDATGRVIGVNSQIATTGGGSGSVGIGFAVPSDTVREVVPRLKAGETIERPWLGVSTAPAASGDGAQVGDVTGGSPAAAAGLRAGDVITEVDGEAVGEPADVAAAIDGDRPGKTVTVKLTRGGASETVELTLGTRPQATPRAVTP